MVITPQPESNKSIHSPFVFAYIKVYFISVES